MSWSDIFFPENPEMKNRLAELNGQLTTLLENCFTAVNHLIDTIDQYLPGQTFEKIATQKNSSIRDNCLLIINRVNEIKDYLQEKEYEVKKLMDTELFNQLMNLGTSFQERIDIARKALTGIVGIGLKVGGIVVVAMINATKVLLNVVETLGAISNIVFAACLFTVFGLAVDMFIHVILGKIEKNKLQEAIQEYEKAVKAFKPGADEFYDNISMVRAMIKVHIKE